MELSRSTIACGWIEIANNYTYLPFSDTNGGLTAYRVLFREILYPIISLITCNKFSWMTLPFFKTRNIIIPSSHIGSEEVTTRRRLIYWWWSGVVLVEELRVNIFGNFAKCSEKENKNQHVENKWHP